MELDDLRNLINKTLLTNEFFIKLDSVAKYDGADILMKHDRYCIKNLGVIKIQDETDEELDQLNKMFEEMGLNRDGKMEQHTFTDVKSVELRNINACAPFQSIEISVPLVENWWNLEHSDFKAVIVINECRHEFIRHNVFNYFLDCPMWIDSLGIFNYLNNCLDTFYLVTE